MSKLTQKALADTLLDQLRTRPLDKITVTDLTDACGLARNTFYYYFRDVYDLLSYILNEELSLIRKKYEADQNWEGGLEATINFIYSHKQAMHNVYQSIFKEYIVEHINDVAYEHAVSIISAKSKGKLSTQTSDLVAKFYSYALLGALTEWIAGGLKTPPQVLSQYFDTMFAGTFTSAIEAAEKLSINS